MRRLIPLALLLATTAAHAADPAAAAAHKQAADEAFLAGDYHLALQRLEAAYAADPQPGYIANQALVLEQLGRYADAVAALERFLATRPDEEKTRKARAVIVRLMPTVRVETDPPGAELRVDDAPASLGTTPVVTRMAAGTYTFELRRAGYAPLRRTVRVLPRDGVNFQAALTRVGRQSPPALTAAPPPPPAPSGFGAREWGYVTLGGAVVAGAAAAVCFALGNEAADARDSAARGGEWDNQQSRLEALDIGYKASAAVAATALVTGALLVVFD
ncbi:MAG: PEGA domain-containing protein [Myxococcales bacterium]|nr:PEGA domain-containing protein [Myxococcales bacterium]